MIKLGFYVSGNTGEFLKVVGFFEDPSEFTMVQTSGSLII